MKKNKTRKRDGEDWRAWEGLPFKLRWLDLWVSRLREQEEQRPGKMFNRQQGDHRDWCEVSKRE